jgi:hypothetical protein
MSLKSISILSSRSSSHFLLQSPERKSLPLPLTIKPTQFSPSLSLPPSQTEIRVPPTAPYSYFQTLLVCLLSYCKRSSFKPIQNSRQHQCCIFWTARQVQVRILRTKWWHSLLHSACSHTNVKGAPASQPSGYFLRQ